MCTMYTLPYWPDGGTPFSSLDHTDTGSGAGATSVLPKAVTTDNEPVFPVSERSQKW